VNTSLEDHYRPRIGGAEDLPERVAYALVSCYHATGRPPTAKRYELWRAQLPLEERRRMPSLTSICPIAYPTWEGAREAAGVGSGGVKKTSHGPTPRWTADDCVALVREWLDHDGSGTIAAFAEWVDGERAAGRDLPSVSTVRLRLRSPWSAIVARAGADR